MIPTIIQLEERKLLKVDFFTRLFHVQNLKRRPFITPVQMQKKQVALQEPYHVSSNLNSN